MGFRTIESINENDIIKTDICVVGSGPAGITAAWYLLKKGVKNVTLIDGGLKFGEEDYPKSWPDKELLYSGVAEGLFATNEPDFLIRPIKKGGAWERERAFGGTSNHWAGQCRPLDPITFEERGGFPGWPIKRADDLDKYYAQASEFFNLEGKYNDHGDNFTTKYWAQKLGASVPELAGFDVEMYQFVGQTNFTTKPLDGNDGKPIGESKVDVILNANLLVIEHSDGVVNRLHLASMNEKSKKMDKQFYITAKAYVLACGAVANARQLLLSNVENKYDQIGSFFMCHPVIFDGVFTKWPAPDSYLKGDEIKLMENARVGGTGITSTGRFSPKADQQQGLGGIGGCWFDITNSGFYFEMAPNKESRVMLYDDGPHDKVFGQKQTKIIWKFSDTDKKTYDHSTELFEESVKRGHNVEVSFASWEDLKSQWTVNGHHIGTTRMSKDAEHGVVDKNLKVHSLDNLYVAGSSVFPTAGISNPTFTIVTLSIRLAEHLSEKFRG